jgi:hypothetical protein
MKYGALILTLGFLLMTAAAQSGRVQPTKPEDKPAGEGAAPVDSSFPVLVNMTPEERQQCGIEKLTAHERERLDRWLLDLLVKLQSLPGQRTLPLGHPAGDAQSPPRELQRQQLQAEVRDLQMRLLVVRQQTDRLSFDLHSARLAASRGDWNAAQRYLSGLESSVTQIKNAAQE